MICAKNRADHAAPPPPATRNINGRRNGVRQNHATHRRASLRGKRPTGGRLPGEGLTRFAPFEPCLQTGVGNFRASTGNLYGLNDQINKPFTLLLFRSDRV
jgi:hypothetical protein